MAEIVKVMAETLAEAAEECGEMTDLLREIRGALHRSLGPRRKTCESKCASP